MSRESRRNLNQKFYSKRLNTESFGQPLLREEFEMLGSKIEKQIEVVKKNMRVKNLKMFRAKQKLKTIHNEEESMRDTLRQKMNSKLQLTQKNLEKIMLQKSSNSKSKSKFRQTTLSRIKVNEQSSIDEAFRKSQMYSRDSQQYLERMSRTKCVSKATSYTELVRKTRYEDMVSTKNQSFSVFQPRKKVLPQVLKVTESLIHDKQARKNNIQKNKEVKTLHDYVQKLQHIQSKRNAKHSKFQETMKTRARRREEELSRIQNNRRQDFSLEQRSIKRHVGEASRVSKGERVSFSQLYAQKLEDTLHKKALKEQRSFREGEKILAKEHVSRDKKRTGKLLKESLREVQLRMNFRFRELLNK